MQVLNNTGMVTGYTMGMEPSGRECIVLAIKGTFGIPVRANDKPQLLDEQVPLVEADTFSGEPGLSSPLFEVDYAPIKHHCDITLVGSAYAPDGRATETVQAGFKVGNLSKVLNVHGDRYWVASPSGFTTSRGLPFERRAITYDIAFGGVDRFHEDESKHDPYMLNPVGIGYHKELRDTLVDNTPAPSTEECDKPIGKPDGNYKPMSFGPVGRGWLPRYKLGGTYDENWLEEHFPFLPPDFDERYYQSAPKDQQLPYLQGGEEVRLLNVTEDSKRAFSIPKVAMPVLFFSKKSRREHKHAVLDTLVLEPDKERFTLTWRASVQLRDDAFEVPEAVVGKVSPALFRARLRDKTYYTNLDELFERNRAENEDSN